MSTISRAASGCPGEGLAFDVLHHDEAQMVALADVVNRGDIRVIQCRCGFRFPREARHPVRIKGKVGRQDLQRDHPIEPGIEGQIDFAHSAGAQLRIHAEVTECPPDQRRRRVFTGASRRDVEGR